MTESKYRFKDIEIYSDCKEPDLCNNESNLVEYLLDPELAKLFFIEFIISKRYLFYGNPVIMATRSSLICKELPTYANTKEIQLMSYIDIGDNYDSFNDLWLYLNKITNKFTATLKQWPYIQYFKLDEETISEYLNSIIDSYTIRKLTEDELIALHNIYDKIKKDFDKLLYNKQYENIISNPIYYKLEKLERKLFGKVLTNFNQITIYE